MDTMEMAVGAMARLAGVHPDDVRQVLNAAVVQVRNAKTLVHGGTLDDGTVVAGMAATEATLQRIEEQVGNLVELLAKPLEDEAE